MKTAGSPGTARCDPISRLFQWVQCLLVEVLGGLRSCDEHGKGGWRVKEICLGEQQPGVVCECLKKEAGSLSLYLTGCTLCRHLQAVQ